jgi:AraC-like DNA-binding protein
MLQAKKSGVIRQLNFQAPNKIGLEIELLTIAELKKRVGVGGNASPTSRANFYRLIGVESGSTTLELDFQSYICKAQDWILVRPGQVLRYDFTTDFNGIILVFKSESIINREIYKAQKNKIDESMAMLSLQGQIENLPNYLTLSKQQHECMRSALKIFDLDTQIDIDLLMRNELLSLQLSSLMIRLCSWSKHQQGVYSELTQTYAKHFKRFRQLLEKDFARHHQVQHYVAQLGMNEKKLNRICQASSGLTAKTYISQRINLEAKRLLAHTVQAIHSIAIELGFDEATNFVKFFKKEVGISPHAFRLLQASTPIKLSNDEAIAEVMKR